MKQLRHFIKRDKYSTNMEYEIYDDEGIVGGPYTNAGDAQADSRWMNKTEGHNTKVRRRK